MYVSYFFSLTFLLSLPLDICRDSVLNSFVKYPLHLIDH